MTYRFRRLTGDTHLRKRVGLHYGVDLIVCFGGLGQADVMRGHACAAGFALERIGYLATELEDNHGNS
jgi:hypothetical protein